MNRSFLVLIKILIAVFISQAVSQPFYPVCVDSFIVSSGSDFVGGIAVSPDGNDLYVGSFRDKKVIWFSLDKATGEMTKGEDYSADVPLIDSIVKIIVSPDGKHIYALNDDEDDSRTILVLSRDVQTGKHGEAHSFGVSSTSHKKSGTIEMVMSPDGKNIYVQSRYNQLMWFDRDDQTGELTLNDSLSIGYSTISSVELVISSDGKHLYTCSSHNGIKLFDRDEVTGDLTERYAFTDTASAESITKTCLISITPNGKYVYTVSKPSNISSIDHMAVFNRDEATGLLSINKVKDSYIKSILTPKVSTMSNDGTKLMLGDYYGDITWFEIDPNTGEFTLIGYKELAGSYKGPRSIAFTPDDNYMFTSSSGNLRSYEVSTAPIFTITSPAEGDTAYNGTSCYIKWNDEDSEASSVYVILMDEDENVLDTLSDGGTTNDGSYAWNIPWDFSHDSYKVKVQARNYWEYSVSGTFYVDSITTPDKIDDNNEYYEGVAIANNSAATSDVGDNQITLNHGKIYTVFKRGSGSSAADNEIRVSIIDKDGNVTETDITYSGLVTSYKPVIASTQSSVVAMYRFYDGSSYRLCVARSTDEGKNFTTVTLGDITPTELHSDEVSRYYIRNSNKLYYSLDDGRNFSWHAQYDDIDPYSYSNFHVSGDYLWIVDGTTSDSIIVYRAEKSNLQFEVVASWYTDMPGYDDYSSSAEDNRCVVYYQHEEVGTYYMRMRKIDGTSLGDVIEISESDNSTGYLDELYLDQDTIYFVHRYGWIDRYVDGKFDSLSLQIDEDMGTSSYGQVGDVIYRGDGVFYGYNEFTLSGSKNNLTAWYWNYNQESPIVPNLSNTPVKFTLNTLLSNGSSKLHFSIGIPKIGNGNLNVKLFNLSGRVLKNINYDINKTGYLKESIDISTMANGVYLMKVQLGDHVLNHKLQLRK